MKIPKEGDRVYVPPYRVPGHEDEGYYGTVSQVFLPNEHGYRSVALVNCTGKVNSRLVWLHHISGYN